MSTSGGFTPPAAPPCPYAPRMTRAAAIALRTAGTLVENCVVVITDGPVIGTAGNTSPTEIELNPVSATDLGLTARVHTTFDPSTAWQGTYDIDLGTAGSITALTDSWGNTAKDPDADSPTVHTQFPWHRGATGFRDNYAEDATLPGWGTATATTSRNRVINSTVDLTGDWSFSDNHVQGSTVTLTQSAGAVRNFGRNEVLGGAVFRSLAGATGNANISDNRFHDGYVTEVAATSTATVTVDGSLFTGHGPAAVDCQFDGSGTRLINDTQSFAHASATQYVLTGGGTVSVGNGSVFRGGRIVRDPATTANIGLARVRVTSSLVQGAGATSGPVSADATSFESVGTNLTQNGPGEILFNSCRIAASVGNSATATRGLNLVSCDLLGGSLTQNRTGGTGQDQISGLTLRGALSSVTLNGAVDPGGNQTPINSVTVESGSSLTLTDPVGSAGIVVQASQLSGGCIVTGTGTGLVTDCRFSAGVSVDLGAFGHSFCVAEGQLNITATAGNTGSLANKSFNDWI
ncbi:hypothetical protein ABZ543_08080 [Streptomyces roseifaciens]